MKFKTTWALIALCGALGAYLYFFDQPREGASRSENDQEGVLFTGFDPARVTEILFDGRKGSLRLKKSEGDHWKAVEPVEDAGDSGRIRALLEDLKTLRADKEVAGAGGDLKPFGLDAPEVVIKTTGQTAALAIGSETPSGDGRYMRAAEGPVKVAKSYSLEGLLVAPDDLRSREIFRALPWEKLNSITVSGPRGTDFRLSKNAGKWRLDSPVTFEADPDAADGLVDKLRWGKIASFLPDRADTRARLASGISVTLSADGLAEQAVLRLAEVDGQIFGQTEGRNALFSVDKTVFDAFRQKPSGLRRMKPVLVKTWSAEKLEISGGGKSARYEKTEGAWRKAGAAVRGDEGEALRQMLQTFEEQKADRVIDSPGPDARYGLDAPRVTVRLTDSQNPEQVLEIGEKGRAVYARAGKTGPVYAMAQRDYLGQALALLKLATASTKKA